MAYTYKKKTANRKNYGEKRTTSLIKYIIWHYTANDGDTDENNGSYFANNIVKASAHYFVDDDSVTQSVPDDYIAWSVGGGKASSCSKTGGGKLYGKATNTNSISIELCDDVRNGKIYPSAETIENALELTKELMKKYDIPASRVIRHFDVTGKICPAYWCGSDYKNELWETIVIDKLTEAPKKEETKKETKKTSTTKTTTKKETKKVVIPKKVKSKVVTASIKAKGKHYKVMDHFELYEFQCHNGADTVKYDKQVATALEAARLFFNVPITISSAYRTPDYNGKVGGAPGSYHTKGRAVDHYCKLSDSMLAKFYEAYGLKGIGCYYDDHFVHIDSRATKFYWQNQSSTAVSTHLVTVKIGNDNRHVSDLQWLLKHKHGFKNLKVDGEFGMATKTAVVEFQKKHKLTPDSIVGKKTWKKLLAI